jgi:hypothetical protein
MKNFASFLLVLAALALSDAANAQRQCPDDRPCIGGQYLKGSTLITEWSSADNWDNYNVRWSRPGRGETQVSVSGGRSGSFRINNVQFGTTYTVKVQGCNSSFGSSSVCSPYYENAYKMPDTDPADGVTTRTPTPVRPQTDRSSFVKAPMPTGGWRTACTDGEFNNDGRGPIFTAVCRSMVSGRPRTVKVSFDITACGANPGLDWSNGALHCQNQFSRDTEREVNRLKTLMKQ